MVVLGMVSNSALDRLVGLLFGAWGGEIWYRYIHVGIQRTSRVALQGAGADPRMNGAGASGWRAEEAGLGGGGGGGDMKVHEVRTQGGM